MKNRLFWSALFTRPTVKVAAIILCVFIICALLAPVLAPYDPVKITLKEKRMPPSTKHLLGTDTLGRDILSRMLHGARVSLSISLISVLIGGGLGMILGLLAGYFGGVVDTIISRCSDALMSIPPIILSIAISTALDNKSNANLMIAIGISTIPGNVRMMRGKVLAVRGRDFITATRVIGSSNARIMFKHLVPNCISPLIISAAMGLGTAIMAEATLSFLGIGIAPPNPAWGSMVSEGMPALGNAPWISLIPGLAIMLIVLSFNIVGDALRDALDPRIRGNS